MTIEKKKQLNPVVNQLTDINIRQPLLTDGREMWQALDFSKKPELEWGEDGRSQVHRLYMTLLDSRVKTKAGISRFVDNYRSYINKLPPKGKAFFIQDFHEHFYVNNEYGIANTFLETMGMNETQTEQINYWTAIYTMGRFSDPDGVSTWTEVGAAIKIAKRYPHFKEDPTFRKAAAEGAEIEITNASSYSRDLDRVDQYVEAGFIDGEKLHQPPLANVVLMKLDQQLERGDGRFAKDIKDKFGIADNQIFTEERQEKAKKGFWDRLKFMAESSRTIADNFLRAEYLQDETVRQKITEQYKADIKSKLGNAIEISENFGESLPACLVGKNIWTSELAESLRAGIIADVAEGWNVIGKYEQTFGLPEELRESPEFRNAVIESLRHSVKWARRDTAEEMFRVLNLGADIWKEVATPEFLNELFDRDGLDKLTEFMGDNVEPIKIGAETIKIFIEKIINGQEQLNSRILDRLANLRENIPEVRDHLNILAGENYPQGATVNDLLDMCGNCLVTSAVTGLYMFTKNEVAHVISMLDSGNSHTSVAFFNVLSRSGFLDAISNDEKDRLIYWVTKWGEQAKTESTKADTLENKRLVHSHWGRYHKLSDEQGPEVIARLYAHKADSLADGIEMFGRTKSIDEIAGVLDRTNPNKLYLVYSKRLKNLFLDGFRKNKKYSN